MSLRSWGTVPREGLSWGVQEGNFSGELEGGVLLPVLGGGEVRIQGDSDGYNAGTGSEGCPEVEVGRGKTASGISENAHQKPRIHHVA